MAEAYPLPTHPRFQDLTGKTYGEWVVVAYRGRNKTGQRWLCRCSCGTEKVLYGSNLVRGNTKSCSCKKGAMITASKIVHGAALSTCHTVEYNTWLAIKQRCYDPRFKQYHDYGGKGITVCERWLESFENFLADMGSRPSNEHSIDRFPNPEGNYEPSNCRWATRMEQASNKTNNHRLELNGVSRTIAEWSRETGIHHSTIILRLQSGWSVERALTTPTPRQRAAAWRQQAAIRPQES